MHKQIGSTLITSLMFVLLISSLCLATSNSSAINSLLNQNITYSTQAYNNLQNTLDFAASTLAKNKHSEKVLDLSKTGKLYNSYKGESWPAENSFPGINASSEYIIEYLGCYPDTSIKIEACEEPNNKEPE